MYIYDTYMYICIYIYIYIYIEREREIFIDLFPLRDQRRGRGG